MAYLIFYEEIAYGLRNRKVAVSVDILIQWSFYCGITIVSSISVKAQAVHY